MLDLEGGSKAFLQLSAAVGLGYSITWFMRQQQLKKFEKIGTVKELVVYPVKSCKGVYVNEAECTQFGLRVNGVGDRHWMLVRDNNRFLSMRQQPQMALISVTISDKDITLDAPSMTTLTLPKAPGNKSAVRQCSVWDGKVEGLDCGDTAAEWINKFLGIEGARLVHYSADLGRRFYGREVKQWATTATQQDVTAFADWASYLLLTEASLAALNKELPAPLDMRSFRPNIILSGPTAFDEDNWSDVRIGDRTQMRCVDACARCVMTTVDPEKGTKREDGEPLKTLKRIRSSSYHKDGAMFGMNLAPDICGPIKVGDPVYALRKNKT